jgi:hypothetical protein
LPRSVVSIFVSTSSSSLTSLSCSSKDESSGDVSYPGLLFITEIFSGFNMFRVLGAMTETTSAFSCIAPPPKLDLATPVSYTHLTLPTKP